MAAVFGSVVEFFCAWISCNALGLPFTGMGILVLMPATLLTAAWFGIGWLLYDFPGTLEHGSIHLQLVQTSGIIVYMGNDGG